MIDDGALAPAVDASMMASAQTPHVRPAADACDWKAWRDARLLALQQRRAAERRSLET